MIKTPLLKHRSYQAGQTRTFSDYGSLPHIPRASFSLSSRLYINLCLQKDGLKILHAQEALNLVSTMTHAAHSN